VSTEQVRIRSPRRTVIGIVVSDKMTKTISVRVSGKVRHPVYGKYVVRHEVYKAHDEHAKAKKGDTVEIAFARRLSKSKFWRLVRIVASARVEAVTGQEEVAAVAGTPKAAAAPQAAGFSKSAEGAGGEVAS
jgi:small subunit ribosomal protein S17